MSVTRLGEASEPGYRLGRFHAKGVVIDGLTLYCGSANLTEKSDQNFETRLRVAGPAAAKALRVLRTAGARGVVWHGQT